MNKKLLCVKALIKKEKFYFKGIGTSMYPTIKNEDIFLVRQIQDKLKVGDVILYYDNKDEDIELVAHRIHFIQDGVFVSKGDGNYSFDIPKSVNNILGIVELGGCFEGLLESKRAEEFLNKYKASLVDTTL